MALPVMSSLSRRHPRYPWILLRVSGVILFTYFVLGFKADHEVKEIEFSIDSQVQVSSYRSKSALSCRLKAYNDRVSVVERYV